jgi:RNA polymerase sigma-70 factor (ECF subfamily)
MSYEGVQVTLRERSFLGGRIFDAFRPAPAEPQPLEVEPVDLPTSTETLSQEEIRAEALLVEQARHEPSAFGVLYERYVDRIYGYIYHRVGNVQEAEDLTARTFYRALDNLDSYEDRGAPFAAWLFRIAHNLMANWHRDRSRRRFLSLDRLWAHSAEDDSPEEKVEQEENQEALWSAINRLPEERRNLLLWKFGSQMSNLEIGELMNKSESAIKSLYFRTLAALRQDLEARGWGGNPSAEISSASPDSDVE